MFCGNKVLRSGEHCLRRTSAVLYHQMVLFSISAITNRGFGSMVTPLFSAKFKGHEYICGYN